MSKTRTRSFAKGAVAGLIGGIAAIAAKNAAEKIYPPRTKRELSSTASLTRKASTLALTPQKTVAQQTMHWGLGAAVGAAYGTVVEVYPAATSKQGASFGMALIALNQDRALPFVGRFAKVESQTKREHTSELVSFVVFGVVTETVRRVVRRMIN